MIECAHGDNMSKRKSRKGIRLKPKHERKERYISMRVTEEDHDRIMALFGDNSGVREFLIEYARDHQDDKP